MPAEDLDTRLKAATPSVGESRALLAGFLSLSYCSPFPAWLPSRLPALQAYLEKHERTLPIRAVWLAGHRLSQLAGADVLGLARLRDRLLERLLEEGLSPERDLPGFLRFAGLRDSERLRVVRDKALDLHQAVRRWTANVPVNLPFVDLYFAFVLAKLGEATPARRLLDDARRVMDVPPPAGWADPRQLDAFVRALAWNALYKAFHYRVEEALAGRQHGGPSPPEVLDAFEELLNKGKAGPSNNPFLRADYVVTRLREQSHLLEPQERLDPYSHFTKDGDALRKEVAQVQALRDPARFAERVRRLYRDGVPGIPLKDAQFFLLHRVLPLSTRAGEAFTVELLRLVPAALATGTVGPPGQEPADFPRQQGQLLERALFLAAHFDRGDLVQQLVGLFVEMVRTRKDDDARYRLVNVVAGQCLRSLRKLGLRDEIDRLLGQVQGLILKGQSVAELRRRHAAQPEAWGNVLQSLTNLAAGWMSFGLLDQAAPVLDEARAELLAPSGSRLDAKFYVPLCRAYVAALGQGPSEVGFLRIAELFQKMDPRKITNTSTTASIYSRLHLNIAEDVVLAVLSDEFTLGAAGRRWLDDDEYLVRRRIHVDLRRQVARSGIEGETRR